MNQPTRRDVLKQLGIAGAGLALAPTVIRGQGAELMAGGTPVEIAVSSVSPNTVRITLQPITGGQAAAVFDDGVLAQAEWGKSLARARTGALLANVKAGNLVVKVAASPLVITVEGSDMRTVQEFKFDAAAPGFSFQLPRGPLLGLGEGGSQYDRKGATDRMPSGQATYMPNTPRGYRLATHGGRVPIQWMVGTDGWGLYIHQPLGAFDFTGDAAKFTPPAGPNAIDLFLVSSKDPAVIMRDYARITGLPEMPALWTLGYLQSHRTLAGPDEVKMVAKTMREKKLPCDALIYLGTDFTPSGWNTHNGEFTWNPKNFPDPKAMIDELHAQHFKVVLHIVTEGRKFTGTLADPCTAPDVPSGRIGPVTENNWPPERQISCYWPVHKPLYDLGIDGWWPDQGDGYDGPSKLARIKMYWEGSQQWRPNERPFALHRNGYPGMWRYGAFLWSGDVNSQWETLKNHVPDSVNTALSGVHLWGTDIGGFIPTAEYTGELHVRWFQFGAFCPLFRAHGRDWHLRLPWGWNTGELGPNEVANFPGPPASELHNAEVEPICRKYLELRYKLMPYLYSTLRECAQTGMPIVRAMWLHHPDDPIAAQRGDQFFWGRDMIVAPVVEKGATFRKLYLPSGTWYDFWTEQSMNGGRELDRPVDLATMPLYVRGGAILPMGPVKQYTSEPSDSPLTLVVYPGEDGAFTLYEDDGVSFAYRTGAWMGIAMSWQERNKQLTLKLAPNSKMLPPLSRQIDVRVVGTPGTKSVTFTGKQVEVKF
ncbi:MAG TPA: TIM-barrel domain-containing protein [Vicinamibacterales bacterium]|nr:TIM-barrel domain-containing protein [Vicinamibacterales bacterium]